MSILHVRQIIVDPGKYGHARKRQAHFPEFRFPGIELMASLPVPNPPRHPGDPLPTGHLHHRSRSRGRDLPHRSRSRGQSCPQTFRKFLSKLTAPTASHTLGGVLLNRINIFFLGFCMLGIKTMALPKWIEDKKAIINMKCDGCFSFKYAVTRALYPVEKRTGIVCKVLEEQSEGLDWSSVVVPDFERNNGIGINLIGLSGGKIVALKVAGWTYWRVITLFFYEDRYYVVKNISRLWSSQINRSRRSRIFCDRCL